MLGHKLLVILNVLFDRIKEQVHSFFLFSLNSGDVFGESVDILGLVNLYFVIFALLDQILDSPFCLVAKLNTGRIRKIECVFVFVQVDEMSQVQVA